jgi:hypothetical protein
MEVNGTKLTEHKRAYASLTEPNLRDTPRRWQTDTERRNAHIREADLEFQIKP